MKLNLLFTRRTLLLPPKSKLIILNIQWILTFITINQHIVQPTTSLTFSIRIIQTFSIIIIQTTTIRTYYILELTSTILTFLILTEIEIFTVDWFTTWGAGYEVAHLFAMWAFYFLADLLGLEIVGWSDTLWACCVDHIFGALLAEVFMISLVNDVSTVFVYFSSALTDY